MSEPLFVVDEWCQIRSLRATHQPQVAHFPNFCIFIHIQNASIPPLRTLESQLAIPAPPAAGPWGWRRQPLPRPNQADHVLSGYRRLIFREKSVPVAGGAPKLIVLSNAIGVALRGGQEWLWRSKDCLVTPKRYMYLQCSSSRGKEWRLARPGC